MKKTALRTHCHWTPPVYWGHGGVTMRQPSPMSVSRALVSSLWHDSVWHAWGNTSDEFIRPAGRTDMPHHKAKSSDFAKNGVCAKAANGQSHISYYTIIANIRVLFLIIFTDCISTEDNVIAFIHPSVCPFVCIPVLSIFWTDWPLTLNFCMQVS